MKASDTIMPAYKLCDIAPLTIARNQAEITWEACLKEVVEWGKEVCPHCIGMTYHYRRVCDTCWQAKLKEWGMK